MKSQKGVNGTSPLKRIRRTRAQVDGLLNTVKEILANETGQITIRHLFYLLVSAGAITKDEASYKSLCCHLANWRRSGEIPFSDFADSTRWWMRTKTYSDADAALKNTVETYRKNLWLTQDSYIELWCEKDAIASILHDAAEPFGVSVFPLRGFASLSSLYVAAETFKRQQWQRGKTVRVYYFGDHDPSGLQIDRSAADTLANDFGIEVEFERVAVTPSQIEELNLPTRPTKKSDLRSKNFKGESVEVDAIPPAELRRIAEFCITQNINSDQWERLKRTEELERESLSKFRVAFEGRDE